MTTNPAAVVLLFTAVAMTMLLGFFAVLSLAVGDHALGLELGLMAVAVAGLTRFVTERVDRSLVRA
jgi:hypothetical protein